MHVVYLLYLGVVQRMGEIKQGMCGTVNKIFSIKTAVRERVKTDLADRRMDRLT
jgi:hypothetical protein